MLRQLTIASILTLTVVGSAAAQQMGKQPYGAVRNPTFAAQFQHAERIQRLQNEGTELQQFVTTYSSNSTSVGNLNDITQILSEGATGTVTSDQGSEVRQKLDDAIEENVPEEYRETARGLLDMLGNSLKKPKEQN